MSVNLLLSTQHEDLRKAHTQNEDSSKAHRVRDSTINDLKGEHTKLMGELQ